MFRSRWHIRRKQKRVFPCKLEIGRDDAHPLSKAKVNTMAHPDAVTGHGGMVPFLRALLTAVAALFLGTLIPTFAIAFHGLSSEKATGLAAVAGGLIESILAPWFWLVFLLFFSLFYIAGGSASRMVRVAFFWIPASAISILGLGIWAFLSYLTLRFGH